MIAYIKGKLMHKEPAYVIVEVGGLGYEVKISLNTFSALKNLDTCQLFTHLHIKETAHTLYGFMCQQEKDCFLLLSNINGVGPHMAMATLSALKPVQLQQATLQDDVSLIKSVKGIGDKTAQRIILELKDKIAKMAPNHRLNDGNAHKSLYEEALAALITLGIHKHAAEKSIHTILNKHQHKISLEELIKLALKAP